MGFLDHGLGNDRAVLEHILQIDEAAVMHALCEIIRIVEMNESFLMRSHDIFRQKKTASQVLAYLPGHIIALYTVDSRILVRILLFYFLIIAVDQTHDLLVGRVGLTNKGMLIPVSDILSGDLVPPDAHDAVLDHILDLLDIGCACQAPAVIFNFTFDVADLISVKAESLSNFRVRPLDCCDDLTPVKYHLLAASLNNLHSNDHIEGIFSFQYPNIQLF